MKNRRNFLKSALLAGAGMTLFNKGSAFAMGQDPSFPKGIIYTSENPGKWAKKVAGHSPVVTVDKNSITITTRHSMSQKHYIVRHTLVAIDGTVLGEKTFYPSDKKAISIFKVAEGHSMLYATSFCNKHDFWVTKFKL